MRAPWLAAVVAAFPVLASAAQGFEYHVPQVKGIAAVPSTLVKPGTKTDVYCRIGNAGTKVLPYGSKELQSLQASSYELAGELSFNGQKVTFKIPPVLPGSEIKSSAFISWTPTQADLGKEMMGQCRVGAGTPYDSQALGSLKVGEPLKAGAAPAGGRKADQDKAPPAAASGQGGSTPAPGTAAAPKGDPSPSQKTAKLPPPPHSWEGAYDSLDNVPKAKILLPATNTHYAVDVDTGTAWQTEIPVRVTTDAAYLKQKLAKSPQAKLYVSYSFLWCPKAGSATGCKTSKMGATQEWPLAASPTHFDRSFSAFDLFKAVEDYGALGAWKIHAMVTSGPTAPGHMSDAVTIYLDPKTSMKRSGGARSGADSGASQAAPAARQ